MALVTLQRSPTPSAASSSASNSELEAGSDEDRKLNLRVTLVLGRIHGLAASEAVAACFFKANRRDRCRGVLKLSAVTGVTVPQFSQTVSPD